MIKGAGGAVTREKTVAATSRRFVCIVDASKLVAALRRHPLLVDVLGRPRLRGGSPLT